MPVLYIKRPNGRYAAAPPALIAETAAEFMKPEIIREKIDSPDKVYRYITTQTSLLEHEVFGCIYLDNRNRVLDAELLFRGTIDGSSVHPREVVKHCLQANAAAVIFYHNHPSGEAEPSQADEVITRRLKSALATLDIRVLDHLVIGRNQRTSFAERGLL